MAQFFNYRGGGFEVSSIMYRVEDVEEPGVPTTIEQEIYPVYTVRINGDQPRQYVNSSKVTVTTNPTPARMAEYERRKAEYDACPYVVYVTVFSGEEEVELRGVDAKRFIEYVQQQSTYRHPTTHVGGVPLPE